MQLGSFSLSIWPGSEITGGYVKVRHGEPYTIRMGNHQSDRCDAVLTVDGKEIGTFRIRPNQTISLERPPNDIGRFTFYRADSQEGYQVGHDVPLSDRGLVSATFYPEVRQTQHVGVTKSPLAGFGAAFQRRMSAGVTGLSGYSGQQFVDVESIVRDYSGVVTITLRLIAAESEEPRPLRPTSSSNPSEEPRPLRPASSSNPEPPPV